MMADKESVEYKRVFQEAIAQYKRTGLFDKVRKEVVADIMADKSLHSDIYADCETMIKVVLESKNPQNSSINEANQRLKKQMILRPVAQKASVVNEVENKVSCALDAHNHMDDVERLVRKSMGLPEIREPSPKPLPFPEMPPLDNPVPPPPPPRLQFEDEPCSSQTVITYERTFESVDITYEENPEHVLMEVSDGEDYVDNSPQVSDDPEENVSTLVEYSTQVFQDSLSDTCVSGRSKRTLKRRTDDSFLYY
ncbi:hypothetical protein L596_005064 [Steinernema carpocapsae]|uniref:BOD1/SHG1 domain-containing protein n=1 Tax=Steinernema carpocapsae TaxID=34508 RepID=A0A4U8V1D0_STECR|nr:hypothetical protein L596_005064 [Steinernema carpocapsae]